MDKSGKRPFNCYSDLFHEVFKDLNAVVSRTSSGKTTVQMVHSSAHTEKSKGYYMTSKYTKFNQTKSIRSASKFCILSNAVFVVGARWEDDTALQRWKYAGRTSTYHIRFELLVDPPDPSWVLLRIKIFTQREFGRIGIHARRANYMMGELTLRRQDSQVMLCAIGWSQLLNWNSFT